MREERVRTGWDVLFNIEKAIKNHKKRLETKKS